MPDAARKVNIKLEEYETQMGIVTQVLESKQQAYAQWADRYLKKNGAEPLKTDRYGRFCIISSPEPSGSQGELIVYPCSGVRCRRRCRRRQQCLNIFSSETALPIKAKFYVEPPWEGGMKVYINGPGHMTKMAAMPIYGKNL